MQYTSDLLKGRIYYTNRVYSPEYSSLGPVVLVDKLIEDGGRDNPSILDVGCGCGVLGLILAQRHPEASVTLSDVDPEAVRISRLNAKRLGLSVAVVEADLLPYGAWDIVVANLPTYSEEDMKQELHGPPIAYSSPEPLALYERLFNDVKGRCKALVCECQPKYQEKFLSLAKDRGWVLALQTEQSFVLLPS